MIDQLQRFSIPAAYALLPSAMNSPAATALLLAIALQESGCTKRRQMKGPARGLFQFERAGVTGILTHASSKAHLIEATETLLYVPTVEKIHQALEHNDTLAAVCARLLLWTLPAPLPTEFEPEEAWSQYVECWRPGIPRKETWSDWYRDAWARVDPPI